MRHLTFPVTLAATVLAALAIAPGAAQAYTTCTLSNHVLALHMFEHKDQLTVQPQPFSDAIKVLGERPGGSVGQLQCGTLPTRVNVDTMLIVDESDDPATAVPNDGDTSVRLDDPSALSPGTSTVADVGEHEWEVFVDTQSGTDRLVAGGEFADIRVGNGGLSWNADGDADVVGMPFDEVALIGGLLNSAETLSGQGSRGTGAPLSTASRFTANGGQGPDVTTGSDIPAGDLLGGGDGADLIDGGAGPDWILPGLGDDRITGGAGTDLVGFASVLSGVTVDLGRTDPQDTGEGADTFASVESARGTDGPDVLSGSADANVLDGGKGDDVLLGRGGADEFLGGEGIDAVSYADHPAGVTVDLGLINQPTDGDSLNQIEDVTGSPFADTLSGNDVANRITGGAGADVIAAGDGPDRVEARDGEGDRVSCGAGADDAVADRRSLDALDGDCETVDALPEPVVDPGQGGGGGGGGGGVEPDLQAPVLSALAVSPARTARGARARRVTVRFGLSEPAALRLRLSRTTRGRAVTVGSMRATGATGANRVRLSGRLGRRRLRPGTYRVTVYASDTAGNAVSRSRTLRVRA